MRPNAQTAQLVWPKLQLQTAKDVADEPCDSSRSHSRRGENHDRTYSSVKVGGEWNITDSNKG